MIPSIFREEKPHSAGSSAEAKAEALKAGTLEAASKLGLYRRGWRLSGSARIRRLDRRGRRATARALGLSDILRGVHRDDLVVLPAQSFMAKQAPSPVEARV
jgi:hypothetical protein